METEGKRILIDGCVGNGKVRDARPDWCNLSTAFLDRLAEAGATPDDIDYVLCTHLHADHVGWNTRLIDGRWVPTFPNATYVFGRTEHAFWQAEHEKGARGPHLQAYRDSVLPILEAGRALVVDEDHVLEGVLHLAPAPGHTPGTWRSGSAADRRPGRSRATSFITPSRCSIPNGAAWAASTRPRPR
ncbi:MBL fold metallo-hydrolase [Methylobacterium sp. XJLW]|uniref:MBL fold metallo-hydrolase n=1 Tax=Methylobacterium sp. XJLW TaxID=739141 RepID=UPI0013E0BD3B|nr:MBL fold metallo-hydrolase [Methylobacterium sp. XJLW]